jgi:hypothetical protein
MKPTYTADSKTTYRRALCPPGSLSTKSHATNPRTRYANRYGAFEAVIVIAVVAAA